MQRESNYVRRPRLRANAHLTQKLGAQIGQVGLLSWPPRRPRRGVRTVLDAPARDVIAWLLAEDELEGAHFLDYETNRKIEEAENGTGQA